MLLRSMQNTPENWRMPKRLLNSCSVMLLLALSGCASPLSALVCPQPPAPPAWMMLSAPDLLTPLNGIISPSESESKPAAK
ncbi:Rz1 family lipoprotein [Buttiauxella massiliensis]|uniref:Rz1 family lipoprotein n=1 Tax=Buttiauxella massiliensis TaxID=2831590 RepID=UPI003898FC7C